MIDGFEQYDSWKCDPARERPDPPDPHEQCERVIERLQAELDAARRPLTYAELFAAVGARVPRASSFAVEVQTWCWRDIDGHDAKPETRWRISWFEPVDGKNESRGVDGASAREALQALYAAVPFADATGIGDLVGEGKVTP